MQVRVEGIGISGECSKVTGGLGLIIITSGRGSNSRYYMQYLYCDLYKVYMFIFVLDHSFLATVGYSALWI